MWTIRLSWMDSSSDNNYLFHDIFISISDVKKRYIKPTKCPPQSKFFNKLWLLIKPNILL